MWNKLSIERRLEDALKTNLGEEIGGGYYTDYELARNYLVGELLGEIKGTEPNLTDHSAKHVADVLNKAEMLLGSDIDKLTELELYCLCLIILFHDAGNINGREEHQKKIADIYNKVSLKSASFLL